ncbi:hypothetical protein VTK26DRAFT_1860 [Humicola hyalothermophila]
MGKHQQRSLQDHCFSILNSPEMPVLRHLFRSKTFYGQPFKPVIAMSRLTSPVFMIALACRRSAPSLRTAAATAQTTTTRPYSNSGSTTSSPKSAEGASATGGGSRSKGAVETGSSPTAGPIPDQPAEGDARGKTGGGAPLESSRDAPSPPKVNSAGVRGGRASLTKEQQAEVDEHNRDFERKHGKAEAAADDKVDKSFWSGTGSRYNKE